MMRKAFSLFTFACIFWASVSFAATNVLLYTDTFENYTNSTPLINGTNRWYASSDEAIVQTNVVATGAKAAMIPLDVALSNRYGTNLLNVWMRTQAKIVRYDYGTNNPTYDTNSTAVFYFDSNGYCVVRNGTNSWVTITNTLSGTNAIPIDTNIFNTIDIFMDYTNKIWRLNINSVQLTNNIGFVNTNATNWNGFDVYNGGLITTYLDNVSIYALPALSVLPSALTNPVFHLANATNQSFKLISRGDGQLSYYIITNTAYTNWSMRITNNAAGSLTNNATNTVWIQYVTTNLPPGIYTNSFSVISTNLDGEIQTVQIVIDVYDMRVSPTNLVNAALYGYDATNQPFDVCAGGGWMSFTAATNKPWLSVSPASGYSSGGETNTLTNTYRTASLDPGDYEARVTVATADGGGATGTVDVALRVYSTPILGASPTLIRQVVDRGGNPTGEHFDVWNDSAPPIVGMSYLVVTNDPHNIIQGVWPSDGMSTGQHNTVDISFRNLSGSDVGAYTAVVAVVATNYGSEYAGHWNGTRNVEVVLVIAVADAPAISATKGDYEDRVTVSWRPVLSPVGGSVTYNVLRHTTFDPNYAHTIVSGLTVTNYDDMTVSPGVKYYYWVCCVNSYGQPGTNSVYDSGYRRLAAPGGLFASDGEYTNKVAVSWAAVDGAAVSYYIYRGSGGAPGVIYHTVGTEYDDTTVTEGVEYTYYVQASNSICGSVLSTGETGYVLSRPTVLSASDGQYAGKIRLSWNAVNGATAYDVWRSTQTLLPPYGGGAKITEMSGTTYDDAGVTAGTKYYYWLKSRNATAVSGFSDREEGFAASAAVDLSVWGLVVQPRRITVGGHPDVISFRLGNNGGAALTGDNGTIRLTFYSSTNALSGDGDDREIGTVDERLELGIGARGIFTVGSGNIVLPAEEGAYYLFMRLAPVWPSILAPASEGGWLTQRAEALEISSLGSINYQAMNDYDGDGISDMVVHGDGLWDARTVDGSEFARGSVFGGSGTAVMGDYDGDNKTDPVVYDESLGYWQALLTGSGYAYVTGSFGGPGYRGVPGDYDGDGKTEAAVYDTINSLWYALKVGGGRVMWGMQFGNIGYEPVIGDYDGDGIWDLAVYNEADGTWYVRTVSGTLLPASGAQWGGPGFRPVSGDYDGDGIWDYAVYDYSTGRWYIVNIYREIIAAGVLWGAAGYGPVAGDFDGDGIADLAVYNEVAGKWYIRTVGGAWIALDASWGGPGRKAVGGLE